MKKITSPTRERHLLAKGFTIVELLIVIAIIGLLTGIIMTSLTPAKSKARDTKRISDLVSVQAALELYYDRCRVYPDASSLWISLSTNNGCVSTSPPITLGTYIGTVPVAPGSSVYQYDVSAARDDYVLQVVLENYNNILKDDKDGNISLTTAISCGSTGTTEREFCLGPK